MENQLPPAHDATLRLASIFSRLIAVLIDGAILFVPAAIANVIVPVAGPVVVLFLYSPVFYASPLHATIGKKVMGIQVRMASGHPVALPAAYLRVLVEMASASILCLGHFLAFFTPRKQALHDLVADTIVVEGTTEGVTFIDAWRGTAMKLFGIVRDKASEVASSSSPEKSLQKRLDELERLHRMRQAGALTEDEYQRLKKDLL